MNDMLKVVQRAKDNPLLAEEYLARESPGDEGADPTAPPVAGGAVDMRGDTQCTTFSITAQGIRTATGSDAANCW